MINFQLNFYGLFPSDISPPEADFAPSPLHAPSSYSLSPPLLAFVSSSHSLRPPLHDDFAYYSDWNFCKRFGPAGDSKMDIVAENDRDTADESKMDMAAVDSDIEEAVAVDGG